jgi:hypothetical protein
VAYESGAAGVSVAVFVAELYETLAARGLPPDGASVKVAPVTLDAFIGSLNDTVTVELTPTFGDSLAGDTVVTAGAVISGAAAVVNVEVNATSEFPARSFAPLVTLTV